MKTINQINSWCKNNVLIDFYENLPREKEKYYNTSRGAIPIFKNCIYGSIQSELNEMIYGKRSFCWRGNNYLKFEFYGHDINLYVDYRFTGVYLVFYSYSLREFINQRSVLIKSNSLCNSFNALEYFDKIILPKYFYTDGVLKNIQLSYNCDKKEAVRKYKLLKAETNKVPDWWEGATDINKALRNRVKKKLNIFIPDEIWATDKLCLKILKDFKRCKVRQTVKKIDLYDLLDGFDGDIDEAETLLNQNTSEKNVIYI